MQSESHTSPSAPHTANPAVRGNLDIHLGAYRALYERATWAHLEAKRLHRVGAVPLGAVFVAAVLADEAWREYVQALETVAALGEVL